MRPPFLAMTPVRLPASRQKPDHRCEKSMVAPQATRKLARRKNGKETECASVRMMRGKAAASSSYVNGRMARACDIKVRVVVSFGLAAVVIEWPFRVQQGS